MLLRRKLFIDMASEPEQYGTWWSKDDVLERYLDGGRGDIFLPETDTASAESSRKRERSDESSGGGHEAEAPQPTLDGIDQNLIGAARTVKLIKSIPKALAWIHIALQPWLQRAERLFRTTSHGDRTAETYADSTDT